MSNTKTMYQIQTNSEKFTDVSGFDTREEAEQYIIKNLQWIEDNNLIEEKNITHEITEYQQELNPKKIDKNAMWVRLMHHYVGY